MSFLPVRTEFTSMSRGTTSSLPDHRSRRRPLAVDDAVALSGRPSGNRCFFVVAAWRIVPCRRVFLAAAAFFMGFHLPAAVADQPTLSELHSKTKMLLRIEASAADQRQAIAAAETLCDWYVILRSDERYDSSKMLQSDAIQVRRRLIGIANRHQRSLRRGGVAKPEALSRRVDAAIEAVMERDESAAADTAAGDETPSSGGLAVGVEGAGGAPLADEGWRLVELIQRVVAPDFWDTRGGPGSIRYFAIRRVLVVRATTDVHEQIKDLLMALR